MTARKRVGRDAILDAAQQIAVQRGAGRLTLDEVARASGLSKGGLLYHFPGKEALLQAMLERLIGQTNTVREQQEALLGDTRHRTLRALLATRCSPTVIDPHVAMAILAAAAEQPALLDPLRAHIGRVRNQVIEESGDKAEHWLLWAAADGLLFQQLLGVAPFAESELENMYQALSRLAEEVLS